MMSVHFPGWMGFVFGGGDVHPSCHGYPLAVTNTTKDYGWGVWGCIWDYWNDTHRMWICTPTLPPIPQFTPGLGLSWKVDRQHPS